MLRIFFCFMEDFAWLIIGFNCPRNWPMKREECEENKPSDQSESRQAPVTREAHDLLSGYMLVVWCCSASRAKSMEIKPKKWCLWSYVGAQNSGKCRGTLRTSSWMRYGRWTDVYSIKYLDILVVINTWKSGAISWAVMIHWWSTWSNLINVVWLFQLEPCFLWFRSVLV